MTSSAEIRARLLDTFRRDLIGPLPEETDVARERLPEKPSRWYLTGFIAPVEDHAPVGGRAAADPAEQESALEEEAETEAEPPADPVMGGQSEDAGESEGATGTRRLLPNSIGLTALLDPDVRDIEVVVTWGDYVPEPPVPEIELKEKSKETPPAVEWRRIPKARTLRIPVPDALQRGHHLVPESAASALRGGGLELQTQARCYDVEQPDGRIERVRALSVMLVNRRPSAGWRRFADVAYAFQARVELRCDRGFLPRYDLSGYKSADEDQRLADLHYRDVAEYAVGHNTSGGWTRDADGVVRRVWTDPLPQAEVERVEPNERIAGVEWGMERLAELAADPDALDAELRDLPTAYEAWIAGQASCIAAIPGARRQETAQTLIAKMRQARERIAAGIALLRTDAHVRRAFRAMNEAVARAARQRNAGPGGDPGTVQPPRWRPFQLAFILLNLACLADERHPEREIVDLLFFPTGGGKTEAYLGLAAWTIAHRRLTNGGKLGAGVAVLMRYTLRLLTLDQLARAAGVICALELMRGEPAWIENGRHLLGDWPIEIGLWIGSAASPNVLGGKGNTGPETAVTRVKRFQKDGKEAPAPLKACPWCAMPFDRNSFRMAPDTVAPRTMEIRCARVGCAFTGPRPLPIVTVDEAIYRRLPAFLIATVDKFAALPWKAEVGAFFGHVDRVDAFGFYGAADSPRDGTRLFNNFQLDPPDLIIQDELHLISGPLGTVAALYETAIDRLATRIYDGARVRPKIVASTATARRAHDQIKALFDRQQTEVFPPPGPDRRDSFFAQTVCSAVTPARLYVGLAAQGKGPKLVFLRALTTLLAAAMKVEQEHGGAADPYMTALCYFNALRELGGARRIVEDEVRARVGEYGAKRRRSDPPDAPFANRRLREPLELTSRVSTDKVAEAKQLLDERCDGTKSGVDVALATNMISVGLDIGRLGLMLVQGQPKTAAEYIQATSRIGRLAEKPGLVLAILNVHKPRDRAHYEQFRHYHAAFYRAVEATSVTPWAARALDRALAAVLVALARHIEPALTPDSAARAIASNPQTQAAVRQAFLDRAPAEARHALGGAIDGLLKDWAAMARQQTAVGGSFSYGRPASAASCLLHDPLDPALPKLTPPEWQRFVAAYSMRDVEPVVPLRLRDA